MINLIFEYRGSKVNIIALEDSPINETINKFLKKIGKPELINNYRTKMKFLWDIKELDYSKNVKDIDPLISHTHFNIVVID